VLAAEADADRDVWLDNLRTLADVAADDTYSAAATSAAAAAGGSGRGGMDHLSTHPRPPRGCGEAEGRSPGRALSPGAAAGPGAADTAGGGGGRRKVMMEGLLEKRGGWNRAWKTRYFVLGVDGIIRCGRFSLPLPPPFPPSLLLPLSPSPTLSLSHSLHPAFSLSLSLSLARSLAHCFKGLPLELGVDRLITRLSTRARAQTHAHTHMRTHARTFTHIKAGYCTPGTPRAGGAKDSIRPHTHSLTDLPSLSHSHSL
jgi:hypothetical protein